MNDTNYNDETPFSSSSTSANNTDLKQHLITSADQDSHTLRDNKKKKQEDKK